MVGVNRTPKCSIEGCGEPRYGRGWCKPHYARWHKTGDPLPKPRRPALSASEKCTVDGCGEPYYAKGWCESHYGRFRRNGSPTGGNRSPLNGRQAVTDRDAPPGQKHCLRCSTNKPLEDFHRDKNQRDGRTFYCKDCIRGHDAARKARDPEAFTAMRRRASYKHRLRTFFGLTLEEYEERRDAQKNRCMICGREERARSQNGVVRTLAVDHDHKTDQIRDLLCDDCNNGLGRFYDDPVVLRAAADYIERHRAGCGSG